MIMEIYVRLNIKSDDVYLPQLETNILQHYAPTQTGREGHSECGFLETDSDMTMDHLSGSPLFDC